MQNTVSNPTEDAPKTPQRKSPTSATASDADTDLETDRGVETAPETEAETELEIDAEKEVEVQVEADEETGSELEPSTPAKPLSIAEQINALTDPSFMTSLARGLAVIKAFSDHRRAMTIAQLSQKTGIPRAAVRRCLYTLKQLGYADSEANNFFLKPGILALGYAFLSSTPLTVAAQPYLTELSHRLRESCVLAVLDQNEVMYVARSHTSRVLSLALNTGSRLPAYCTAIGRVLLAGLSANQLDRYFSSVVLTPHTERTVVSEQKLRDIVFEVRRRGFAVVEEELEIGLRSIAVPVRGASGATVAALSIGAQVGRISRDEIEDLFLPSLLNASNEICLLLP
ncbi:MAG: IclR family transcriptional regulator [Oxalobacteraceae bacterium]|nr:IclR family transcriptional regulator [Oxalobacteraceae bacterium]